MANLPWVNYQPIHAMNRYGPAATVATMLGQGTYARYKRRGKAKPKKTVRSSYNKQTYKRSVNSAGKRSIPKRKGTARDVALLKSAVKDLKSAENASLGKYTFRGKQSFRLLAPVNGQVDTTYASMGTNDLEAAGTSLQYFDPANPGTLVTAAMATGDYSRKFLIKSMTARLTIRNNYKSDADVTVYLCRVRDDTSQTPSAAFANVTDNAITGDRNTLNMYPSDSELFNQLWKPKKLFDGVLAPGKQIECSNTEREYEYDPSTADTHTLAYQKEYKAFCMLVLLRGTIMHDETANQQGIGQAGIDIVEDKIYKIHYDAGINVERVNTSVSLDSFTNGGVQSNQPIPDNVGYAVN